MDAGLSMDPHILNAAFSEIVESDPELWISPLLVTFSSKRSLRHLHGSASRSVKVLDNISIDYAVRRSFPSAGRKLLTRERPDCQVPFPLHFLFDPPTMKARSSIFILLLQLRRAKNLTSRLSLFKKDEWQSTRDSHETLAFYALRKRLAWIVK